ncbi:MAG TPA: DUF3667 domain-containing protein [Saprospiraceae bacterium]|nr:DUF3667 domain-containing protein [Saprospiraceae bacterium]
MKRYCRNCYHPLSYKAKFCAQCGQKDTDGRVGMKSLLSRLWNNTFHLEGKFIRTAWQLFIPGKVTQEFFKGKQDRYPHPIRLFAIVMFLFLFMVNSMLNDVENGGDGEFFNYQTSVETEVGDTVVAQESVSDYERMKFEAARYDMIQDYKKLPENQRTPEARQALDTLLRSYAYRHKMSVEPLDSLFDDPPDTVGMGVNFFDGKGKVEIATMDLVRYEPEEVIRRYKLDNWFQRTLVRQGIKAYKSPEAFIHAAVGSLTWAILALVAIMSFVLGLLYVRQNKYYVEHFIFLLHFHTGAMLLLLIATLGELLHLWGDEMVGFAAFLPFPGMYMGMLRYYNQGWFKTLVKFWLYAICYLIAFVLLFVLGMIVVFAFY